MKGKLVDGEEADSVWSDNLKGIYQDGNAACRNFGMLKF